MSRVSLFLFAVCFVLGVSSCSPMGPRSDDSYSYHLVKEGESLWSISQDYGMSVEHLRRVNDLDDPDLLQIGKRLAVSASSAPRSLFSFGPVRSNPAVKFPMGEFRMGEVYTDKWSPDGMRGGKLSWPVLGGRLVSRFGPRGRGFHDGVDVSARIGTPVLAAHDGKVVVSGSGLSGFGKLLVVEGDDDLFTLYAHNHRLGVSRGDKVRRGQMIAELGRSGNASGPHLHFEVRMRDNRGKTVSVDPMPLLKGRPTERPRYRVNEGLNPIFVPQ